MSDQPAKKPGRVAEIRQAYRAIKSLDPRLGWWMLGAGVLAFLVVVTLGALFGGGIGSGWFWYSVLVALPTGFLAATLVMNRRGNKAMYGALEGKVGAAGATLNGMGRRGWYADQEPVAVEGARGTRPQDMAGAAMVFRALGRPGIVLIGEGPGGRVRKMLK